MAKKIKKTDDLLSFIKEDNAEEEERAKARKGEKSKDKINIRRQPSKRWKRWLTLPIDDWTAYDFLGFYLHNYLEVVGEEDIDFKNRAVSYKFGPESGYVKRCLNDMFDGNKVEFKQYITWIVKWWMTDESFPTGFPSAKAVFTSKSGAFLKIFKAEGRPKPRIKKLIKRKEADNNMAGKDAWDQYFEDGEV